MPTYDVTVKTTYRVEGPDITEALQTGAALAAHEERLIPDAFNRVVDSEILGVSKL